MDIERIEKVEGSVYMTVTLTDGNVLAVPATEDNTDYKEIMKQVNNGDITITIVNPSSDT
jgi:hypothetical protein